jgi:hypothetical protein
LFSTLANKTFKFWRGEETRETPGPKPRKLCTVTQRRNIPTGEPTSLNFIPTKRRLAAPHQSTTSRLLCPDPPKPTRKSPITLEMAARVLLQRVRVPIELPPYNTPKQAAKKPLKQRAAPLTAAILVGGIAFAPRIAHAEAPEERHLVSPPKLHSSPSTHPRNQSLT